MNTDKLLSCITEVLYHKLDYNGEAAPLDKRYVTGFFESYFHFQYSVRCILLSLPKIFVG